jgi:anti-sigma B factor antagonist
MPLPHESLEPQGPIVARLESQSLGESDAGAVLASLLELAGAGAGRELHLDLSGLEYVGSTGLGVFVTLNRAVKAGGGRLSLLNVRAPVYEVFALTRLTSVLDVRAA